MIDFGTVDRYQIYTCTCYCIVGCIGKQYHEYSTSVLRDIFNFVYGKKLGPVGGQRRKSLEIVSKRAGRALNYPPKSCNSLFKILKNSVSTRPTTDALRKLHSTISRDNATFTEATTNACFVVGLS